MKRRRRVNWPYLGSIFAACAIVAVYVGVQTLLGGFAIGSHMHGHDWGFAFVTSLMDVTVTAWFFAVGASIGSFLNVVAYRLPLGRGIGGNSSCPRCRTAIRGSDNIPIFAWIKLRGRCRSCELPISIQYPLVELAVGILFLVFYFSEFRSGGLNLPFGTVFNQAGSDILGIYVSPQMVVRTVVYLFALSGLFAAGLMAAKRRPVPLSLYLWCLGPIVVAAFAFPASIVVRWRDALPVGPTEARLDALVSVLCGVVGGLALARLAAPLVYVGFDRTFISKDRPTTAARQFVGAMAVAGGIVGWQAVVPMSLLLLVAALIAVQLLQSYRQVACLSDLTVWVWLGLLMFRAFWHLFAGFQIFESGTLKILNYLLPALLFAVGAQWFFKLANSPLEEPAIEQDDDDDDWDEDAPRAIRPIYEDGQVRAASFALTASIPLRGGRRMNRRQQKQSNARRLRVRSRNQRHTRHNLRRGPRNRH